ncbi:MAG: cation:proton antiporter [Planctomycetota bacterium]|jgi:NhaP-type Na+/H+ or K+/H+ antiporter
MPSATDAASDAWVLLILGLLFLLGLGADLIGRRTFLPRVTLLLIAGLAIGPSVLDLVPADFVRQWFPLLTNIALGMIGFLLGGKLTIPAMRRRGFMVVGISIGKVLGAFSFVLVTLLICGVEAPLAMLFAAIAPATAPAATFDVVHESEAKGEFPDTLLSVVAIDDAWGLLLFTLVMATSAVMVGAGEVSDGFLAGFGEVGGSLLLGVLLGIPMAYLTGRVREGEPTLAEALGLVFLCTGLAIHLQVSPILATMAMGSSVASLARHHSRPFHAIEGIEWPFLIAFFVLAGASLEIERLLGIGVIGSAYILARSVGLYTGARLGSRLVQAPLLVRRWLGLALLPQAGVAIGMALMASQRFPRYAEVILSVILASTIIYELVAPIITRRVIEKVELAQ